MWAQTLLSGIWELQNSFARSIRHVQHPLLLYSIYPILYPNVGRGQSVTEKVANVDKDNKNKLLMMTCGSQKYVYRACNFKGSAKSLNASKRRPGLDSVQVLILSNKFAL